MTLAASRCKTNGITTVDVRSNEVILYNQEGGPQALPYTQKKTFPWLRLGLAVGLSALGLWYVTRNVALSDLRLALASARPGYILLALVIYVGTTAAKTWRWRLLYHAQEDAPAFGALFWAVNVGQLINTAVPFVRLGELARVYDLGQHTGQSKVQGLGTLVVEKTLDLISLAFLFFVLVPFFVLPDLIAGSGPSVAIVSLMAFVFLVLVARRTDLVRRLAAYLIGWLPEGWQRRLLPWVDSGLAGLAALRSGRASLVLLGSTLFILLLSVLTPYLLLPALGIPLGLKHGAVMHIALTVGAIPPSTPARIGIFEGIVIFVLATFGVEDSAVRLAYALIFHLLLVVPQLVLGGIGLLRRQRHG